MQQQLRTCQIVGHYSKAIEYVCTYPECQMTRFLCSKCALGQTHNHNLQDNSHIVDHLDFCTKVAKNSIQRQQESKYDIEKSVSSLKQIYMEISTILKNLENIILQIEQGNFQAKPHLENIQKQGFNFIDEQTLSKLINMKQQLNDQEIYDQLENYSRIFIQNAQKIKNWRLQEKSQIIVPFQPLQYIQNMRISSQAIIEAKERIQTAAISKNLKYIAAGSDKHIKVWDYLTNDLIKSIQLGMPTTQLIFTEDSTLLIGGVVFEDSTLLNGGVLNQIIQFDADNQFKELNKVEIPLFEDMIWIVRCITNSIMLISTYEGIIIKMEINLKHQLLKIKSDIRMSMGLDYNKHLNLIAIGSSGLVILYNANDGQTIIEKQFSPDHIIMQLFFIQKTNQLVGLVENAVVIWNINMKSKQLERQSLIKDQIYNISLAFEQQYIVATAEKYFIIYSISGQFIQQLYHDFRDLKPFFTIQPDSLKAILIGGDGFNAIFVIKFKGD